ncbi:hypothetical protein R6Q59_022992 [Mikania micrantha]
MEVVIMAPMVVVQLEVINVLEENFEEMDFVEDFSTKEMIRSPNFHIRKRKWKTVLFLLRKRKRKIEEPCNDVKPPIDAANLEGKDGGDSRWLVDDHDDGDGYCSVAEERDENPRNVVDPEFEGFERENPSLELHRDEEVDESLKSASLIVSERKKDGGDTPPDDDCCPICFDNFSIACKTNCGHWFCGKREDTDLPFLYELSWKDVILTH